MRQEENEEVKEAWCEMLVDEVFVQHGPYRAWHAGDKLAAVGQFQKGKPVGVWKYWYDNGNKQREEKYEKGNRVSVKYWDYKGKPVDPKAAHQAH